MENKVRLISQTIQISLHVYNLVFKHFYSILMNIPMMYDGNMAKIFSTLTRESINTSDNKITTIHVTSATSTVGNHRAYD